MNTRPGVLSALVLCGMLAGAATFAADKIDRRGCPAEAASSPRGGCAMPMHGRAHGRWGADYTPGWMLMTPQERKSFAEKMHAAGSREECLALVEQQRAEIETRAKATGQRVPHRPRRMACNGFPGPAPQ